MIRTPHPVTVELSATVAQMFRPAVAPIAVARPVASTVACVGSDDVHVTVFPFAGFPLVVRTTGVNSCWAPTLMVAEFGPMTTLPETLPSTASGNCFCRFPDVMTITVDPAATAVITPSDVTVATLGELLA